MIFTPQGLQDSTRRFVSVERHAPILLVSSSSFVLGRFLDGTSETTVTCFLYASFFHSGKPPRSPTDEDEQKQDWAMALNRYQGLYVFS
jgi:hypothetical protein